MLLYVEHEHCNSSGSSVFSHFIGLEPLLGVCLLQMLLDGPLRFAFSCSHCALEQYNHHQ